MAQRAARTPCVALRREVEAEEAADDARRSVAVQVWAARWEASQANVGAATAGGAGETEGAEGSAASGGAAQVCAPACGPATSDLRLRVPLRVAALLAAALRAAERAEGRLLDPSGCLERVAGHFLAVWSGLPRPRTTPQRRALRRDGGRCQVPGCSRAAAHAHHVRYRSQGGGDEASNLVSLCAAHHLHGVHRGFVRVRGVAPDRLTWELGERASPRSGRGPSEEVLRPVTAT